MPSDEPVLMPNQGNDDKIEDRQQYKADAVCVGEAVELVDDQQAHDDQGCRVGPKLRADEPSNQEQLHDAVTEQVKSVEMLRLDGKSLRPVEQRRGDNVMPVLDQLILRQTIDEPGDGPGADDGENKPANAFN